MSLVWSYREVDDGSVEFVRHSTERVDVDVVRVCIWHVSQMQRGHLLAYKLPILFCFNEYG